MDFHTQYYIGIGPGTWNRYLSHVLRLTQEPQRVDWEYLLWKYIGGLIYLVVRHHLAAATTTFSCSAALCSILGSLQVQQGHLS